MAIKEESQRERDTAFKHGVAVVCPLCGSSVVILRKVTLCPEYRDRTLTTARLEWHCYWCEHDWAVNSAAPRNLFTSNPDIVQIIPVEGNPNPLGTPMEDYYDADHGN